MKLQSNLPSFRVEQRLEIEKWRNKGKNEALMPTSLVTKDLLPPLLIFYEIKVNYDPRKDDISKNAIKELKSKKWHEEKITTFNQCQIESRN